MVNKDTKDIAKNSAVKNLKSIYQKEKEIVSIYERNTAHVKAGIAYNDCLKHFNAPFKYEPMKNGDKSKMGLS